MLGQVAMVLLLFTLASSSLAGVREVGAIGLTVNDLGRQLDFYTNTLPFEMVSISDNDLLGL